ncbi:hypothetical protein BKA63DRAFT_582093 [Paraphoma chrysanthemicola]|nr:hypothetical protein BKA63DRAFT_582093 [Paraphoma chrysanthemicola]
MLLKNARIASVLGATFFAGVEPICAGRDPGLVLGFEHVRYPYSVPSKPVARRPAPTLNVSSVLMVSEAARWWRAAVLFLSRRRLTMTGMPDSQMHKGDILGAIRGDGTLPRSRADVEGGGCWRPRWMPMSDAAFICKGPCHGLAVPVAGGCRPGRGCRSISGKTLGWKMANGDGASSSTPDRAWVPMGQQLGLPAARATRQEVLGAAKVEPFTLVRRADWPAPDPIRP